MGLFFPLPIDQVTNLFFPPPNLRSGEPNLVQNKPFLRTRSPFPGLYIHPPPSWHSTNFLREFRGIFLHPGRSLLPPPVFLLVPWLSSGSFHSGVFSQFLLPPLRLFSEKPILLFFEKVLFVLLEFFFYLGSTPRLLLYLCVRYFFSQ